MPEKLKGSDLYGFLQFNEEYFYSYIKDFSVGYQSKTRTGGNRKTTALIKIMKNLFGYIFN